MVIWYGELSAQHPRPFVFHDDSSGEGLACLLESI